MASATPAAHGDEAQRHYLIRREEKDQRQQKFFEKLDVFPHLFSLRQWLRQNINNPHIEALLGKQQREMAEDCFPYYLEKTRCHNLIIFLLYHLGRTREAFDHCEAVLEDPSKSIIFLTLRAVLQWELNRKQDSTHTVENLQDLYKVPDFEYQLSVAESEKAHLLICVGPKGFLTAVDLLRKVINGCRDSDVFLWKYDLALAIRRNFNVQAYSEHQQLSASDLAREAVDLLKDAASTCPNPIYKARATVELSRLITHLLGFVKVAREEDREPIKNLCENVDYAELIEKLMDHFDDLDYYVLRECGRHFMHSNDFGRAVRCLDESLRKHKNSMVYQVFGKTYLYMYGKKVAFIPPTSFSADRREQNNASDGETLEAKCSDSSSYVTELCGGSYCSSVYNDLMIRWADEAARCRPNAVVFQCPPGQCPVQHDPGEAELLAAEFDRNPYMDEAGHLRTTQSDGVGPILPFGPLDTTGRGHEQHGADGMFGQMPYMDTSGQFGTSQTSVAENVSRNRHPPTRAQSAEETRLLEEFEESSQTFLNPDGTLRTSQRDGIGSIRPTEQSWPSNPQEGRPTLQTSHSFPPPTSNSYHGREGGIGQVGVSNLLQCKHRCYFYNISDPRIQTAETFYLKGIELNPRNYGLLYDIGRMYESLRDPRKALEFYERIFVERKSANALNVVNAYERSGWCYLNMSEHMQDVREGEDLKKRAEDMFMRSLVECRQAVTHLPNISANRASLWTSYASLLDILRHSEGYDSRRKEADAHELAGKHLEAIEVYREVLGLAETVEGRTEALRGTISNHLSASKVKEAKFILDLFLTSDQRSFILTDENNVTKRLRHVAAQVYSRAFQQALTSGDTPDAHAAVRSALVLKHVLPDADACGQAGSCGAEQLLEQFDVCIFYDDDAPDIRLEKMSKALSTITRTAFGMRVSVNDEGAPLGRLSFFNELRLAESTPLVILVVAPGSRLSSRMAYIVNTVLQSDNKGRVLPILVDGTTHCLPNPLHCLQPYARAEELLPLVASDVRNHVDAVCNLFEAFLEGHEMCCYE